MSYYESAEKINKDLKQLFNSLYIREFNKEQRESILNLMIRLGAVAKFRCRNNSAYDNFIKLCFDGIAKTKRVKLNPSDEYEVLVTELESINIYEDFLLKNKLDDNKENFTLFVKSINKNYEVI